MGTKDRKSKEKKSRHQAILDAAEKVIGVQGLHGLSMDSVAREAELAKGTLYLYFDSKEKILAALSLKARLLLLDEFRANIKESDDALEQLSSLVWASRAFQQKYPLHYELLSLFEADHRLVQTPELFQASNQLVKFIVEIAKRAQTEGLVDPRIDSQHFALCFWGMTVGIMQLVKVKGDLIIEEHQASAEDLLKTFVQLLNGGLTKHFFEKI